MNNPFEKVPTFTPEQIATDEKAIAEIAARNLAKRAQEAAAEKIAAAGVTRDNNGTIGSGNNDAFNNDNVEYR